MLPDGLNDLNLTLSYTHPKAIGPFKSPALIVTHHDLRTDRNARDVGSEWDAQASAKLTKNLTVSLKYADFERANATMPASRTKTWVSLEYKY